MKATWASVVLIALAGATSRCNCEWFRARLGHITTGVAEDEAAPVTPATKVGSAKYLACVLDYANLPAKSQVVVVWSYYPTLNSSSAFVISSPETREVAGNGDVTAAVKSRGLGVYECEWKVKATTNVENDAQTARIVVGDPPP